MPRATAGAVMRRLAVLAVRGSPPGQPGHWDLTRREGEVLELLAEGLTDREIARMLSLSPRTVEKHVGSILRKTSVKTRHQAAMRFQESPKHS